jgi:peptide/nickel transport system permease protein
VILFALIKAVDRALPTNMQELELAIETQMDLSELPMEYETDPVWRQFLDWMGVFYRGDLGESASLEGKVSDILINKLPRTLLLLLPGTVTGFLLGIGLGKRVGWRRRGWLEMGAALGGTAFYTTFPPWLAFVMIRVFGLSLGWFPPEKLIDPLKWVTVDITLNQVILRVLLTLGLACAFYLVVAYMTRHLTHASTIRRRAAWALGILTLALIPWLASGLYPLAWDLLYHLILPLATLTLLSFGETMLIMKTMISETAVDSHVISARAKGLPEPRVRDRHGVRVAILPVLTRFVVHLPYVIIGTFVLEKLFFWDGMGMELVRAANENDLPVLMGVLSLVGVGILFAHLILDLLTAWLDPRLRQGAQENMTI